MNRSWRLIPAAEESLVEIAVWTIATFGPAQAEVYEGELIVRCQAIANGLVVSRDCSVLVGESRAAGLRFTREFLHSRSGLPSRIAALEVMGGR